MIGSYEYPVAVGSAALALAAWPAVVLYRLRRRKAFFEAVFEQSPEAAVLATGGGRVIRINRTFTQLFGYSPPAAIGHSLEELIVPPELRVNYRTAAGPKRRWRTALLPPGWDPLFRRFHAGALLSVSS